MKKVMMYLGLIAIFLLSACGNEQGSSRSDNGTVGAESGGNLANPGDDVYGEVEMSRLRSAVVEIIGDNYWPNSEVAEDDFQDEYGVKPEMYEDYFAEEALVETSADALVIVKAAPGQAEAVEKALNAYREKLVDETTDSPENSIKSNASRIEIFGSYVCFVQLGADLTTLMEQGEEAVMLRCQEENEKALDAIRTALLK